MATIIVFKLNGEQIMTFDDTKRPDRVDMVNKASGLDIGAIITFNNKQYRIIGVEDKTLMPKEASGFKNTIWKREFSVEKVDEK